MEVHQQHVHKKHVKTLVTMEGRFEHDPSMTRDRPETVVQQSLTFQVRGHPLHRKTQHFVHPLSLKNGFCTKTHFLRDFLPECMLKTRKTKQFCENSSKNVTGRRDPTRHESAIYFAGTILKLQNAMEVHQQHVHKKHVKTLVTMEGRFEHDPSMTRDRPETVVPQSLTFQVRGHPLHRKTQHFVHPLSLKNVFLYKNSFFTRLPSKVHAEDPQNEAILREFLKKCDWKT